MRDFSLLLTRLMEHGFTRLIIAREYQQSSVNAVDSAMLVRPGETIKVKVDELLPFIRMVQHRLSVPEGFPVGSKISIGVEIDANDVGDSFLTALVDIPIYEIAYGKTISGQTLHLSKSFELPDPLRSTLSMNKVRVDYRVESKFGRQSEQLILLQSEVDINGAWGSFLSLEEHQTLEKFSSAATNYMFSKSHPSVTSKEWVGAGLEIDFSDNSFDYDSYEYAVIDSTGGSLSMPLCDFFKTPA